MGSIELKSTAKISVDDLGNVWYLSDVELVLGKIGQNDKFNAVPNKEFTAEMLSAISSVMKQYEEKNIKKP